MQKPIATTEIIVPIPTIPPIAHPASVTESSTMLLQTPTGNLVLRFKTTIMLSLGPTPSAVLIYRYEPSDKINIPAISIAIPAAMLPAFLQALKQRGYKIVALRPGTNHPALRTAPEGWTSETEKIIEQIFAKEHAGKLSPSPAEKRP